MTRPLIDSQGEEFAVWDSGASHFLLPRQLLPKSAKDTKEASIRLAIGEQSAVYWRGEVYSDCCNMVLVPAGKVTRVLGLYALQSPKDLTCGSRGVLQTLNS
eukprot:4999174-Amphidinium_carterae.1